MLGWFLDEPTEPAQLLATIPQEEPNYLAGYIKQLSSQRPFNQTDNFPNHLRAIH